ncbi:hypothetical protein CEXT_574041 [Caerostris extrusa]|uniref:Uncharacterized protein n=1 Tax=Caerostris extrusa TaxID=172846 RepID=A0AAV4SH36_CAEEX|nr:hypothetical protein CEXT_574041 [Caerostris extrusa]
MYPYSDSEDYRAVGTGKWTDTVECSDVEKIVESNVQTRETASNCHSEKNKERKKGQQESCSQVFTDSNL